MKAEAFRILASERRFYVVEVIDVRTLEPLLNSIAREWNADRQRALRIPSRSNKVVLRANNCRPLETVSTLAETCAKRHA